MSRVSSSTNKASPHTETLMLGLNSDTADISRDTDIACMSANNIDMSEGGDDEDCSELDMQKQELQESSSDGTHYKSLLSAYRPFDVFYYI